MAGRSGWEQVLIDLVAERGVRLTRYAYLLSGSRDDAADLVQDALVRTFERLRKGFTLDSAEAYVRRSILNAYLDDGRRSSRWRATAHLHVTPEGRESPSQLTDTRLDLRAELAKLTPRERACIVLRYYDDLTIDDVAGALGIASGTVKRYVSDALAKMAVALIDDDVARQTSHALKGLDHAE